MVFFRNILIAFLLAAFALLHTGVWQVQAAPAPVPDQKGKLWHLRAAESDIETERLKLYPDNPNDTLLFDVENMVPGDIKQTTIRVRNDCTFSFALTMEVNFVPEAYRTYGNDDKRSSPELAQKFDIAAYLGGVKIPDFPAKIPADGTVVEYNFNNAFMPNSTAEITFVVSLDGPNTGNEYQDLYTKLQWNFYASRPRTTETGGGGGTDYTIGGTGPPLTDIDDTNPPLANMPGTGEPPLWYWVLPGSILILLGGALLFRENKRTAMQT